MYAMRITLLCLLLLLSGALSGCREVGYYLHAVGGHLQIMVQRQPISELLEDHSTPEELRAKLVTIESLRRFASEQLALPENTSYRSYVALDRPYVVWNVVATPEFSLTPKTWCFPFAGCVSYRGYFDLDKASDFAESLAEQGYETTVSGVPAYSTLNWFADPALSTFSGWSTSSMARLIFHELAHQELYVQDDSAFNESFATTVELAGVELWLERFGSDEEQANYRQRLVREQEFMTLTMTTRERLNEIYVSPLPDSEKRQLKEATFSDLRRHYAELRTSWNDYPGYDRWFDTLNNARFAALNTYQRWVPAFKLALRQEQHDFPAFYRRCRAIADLPVAQRTELLERLTREYQAEAAGRLPHTPKDAS